ncbi:MAG TPA: NAD-dependent epimerase/dehydratase family protein [Verrucomicrobiae bacterium]|nr:NAD-dependent epimerase/dehydratase family protein [Verrucomicrobiae bacterium]
MKRIILAGGSGFLGHALAGHFQKSGHEMVILTRSPEPGSRVAREVA